MADIDYTKLNRTQKLAVFLICIGPESAAEVLKHFDDVEIENLCREMAGFPMISEGVQQQAFEEFSSVVAGSVQSASGGINFAQRTLEIAKGGHNFGPQRSRLSVGAFLVARGPCPPGADLPFMRHHGVVPRRQARPQRSRLQRSVTSSNRHVQIHCYPPAPAAGRHIVGS